MIYFLHFHLELTCLVEIVIFKIFKCLMNLQNVWVFFSSDNCNSTNRNFLLNVVCLVEKPQIPILWFGLTRSRLKPTIYPTQDDYPITPPM
jgi:hypothetical protein